MEEAVFQHKVEEVEYVLAVIKGIIVDAFEPKQWKKALRDNFPEFNHLDMPNRYGFVGVEASKEIKRLYINKAVPAKYRKKGASNPVKYSF